jgi:short-subunit dehydrogenase
MWVGPFQTETDATAARQVEVNLLGVIRGTRLAAARMAARGRGHVITIASAASKLAPPGEATYAATKHGVHGYLSAVRAELRRSGVQISLVMPGVVDTELAAGTRTGPVRRLRTGEVAEAVLGVVRRPRFETVVPRQIALLHKASAVLPQPVRDLLLRVFLPNQVAAVRNDVTRHRYESTHFDGSP